LTATNFTEYPFAPDIESSTADYATRFAGPVGNWFLKVQAQITKDIVARVPGKSLRVLDVGGGHGQNQHLADDPNIDLTVVGSNTSCATQLHHDTKFTVATLHELPFEDRAFDLVLSYRIISHIVDWERYCEELARVSNHAVAVDYATKSSLSAVASYAGDLKNRIEGNARPFRSHSHEEVVSAFSCVGFARSGLAGQYILPMAFHRMLKRPKVSQTMEKILSLGKLRTLFGSPCIAWFKQDE